jgi:hypothetical protein
MNSKLWIRKAISSCLMVAMLATYSMVALAGTNNAFGELIVNGQSVNGETPIVTVNGEAAKTGRTIFTSSTITTPEFATATVNMGKAGEIELFPNTTLLLSFDNNSASVDLLAGTLTVLKSNQLVNVKAAGATYGLSSGESASASSGKTDHDYRDSTGKCIDANKNGKLECDDHGAAWWLWALVFGGAAAGIIVGASQGNNSISLGGGGAVISPNR